MIYFCEDCGFVFCRTGEINECPYCGMYRIRAASGEEVEKLRLVSEQQKTDFYINKE